MLEQWSWCFTFLIACNFEQKRHTRKDNLSSGKPKLPKDFVKRKRAYFEEIDAFELGEEAYLWIKLDPFIVWFNADVAK